MELTVSLPKKEAILKYNKDDVMEYIKNEISKYENLIYDDESIKSAKDDRARLNSFTKAINDKKIEIKKQFLEPYTEFENDVKEMMSMIAIPIESIDKQVKLYEEKLRVKRRSDCVSIFSEIFGELQEVFSYNSTENSKWLNQTTSIKSIRTEITEIYNGYVSSIKVIKDLNSDHELALLEKFYDTRDILSVMEYENRLKAQAEKERLYREAQAVQYKPTEEELQVAQTQASQVEAPEVPQVNSYRPSQAEIDKNRKWYNLRFFMDEAEAEELRKFIRELELRVERCDYDESTRYKK